MATPAAILSILVKADGIAKTQAQVGGLDKSVEKAGKNGHKSMTTLAKGAGLAGVAFAGLAAVGIKKATDAFYESQKVARQTNAVLKSTGKEAGVTAKQVANLATQLSKKTGVDDEAIQSGENLLLTFTKIHNETGRGNDVFNRATKTIVDMSAALGQDMKSSAIQVGKALNDPIKGVTALQRVGVSFTAAQKEQIKSLVDHGHALDAQKVILRELNKEFGGSAAAQATNMDRLKVSLGNLQESVGSVFVPVLEKATGRLNTFVDGMTSGEGAGGRLVQALKDLGKVMGDNSTVVFALTGALVGLTAAQIALNVAMATNPYILAAAGILALVAAVVVAYHEFATFRKIVDDTWAVIGVTFTQGINGVVQMFNGFKTTLKGIIDIIAGIFTLDFRRIWTGVGEVFKGGINVVVGIFKQMTAPFRAALAVIDTVLSEAFGGTWDKIKGVFRGGVNAVIDFLNVLIRAINKIPLVPDIGEIGRIGGGDRSDQGVQGHARGGAFARTGGVVNKPITLMGEEAPRYPEFVIPTNPAYRGRAQGLLGRAASAIGLARGGMYSQGEIMNLWNDVGGAGNRRVLASAIAMAESGGNANASSSNPAGGVNRGLFQIWSGNPGSTFDPMGNTRTARNMSHDGSNWGQWEAFTNGAYKKFMRGGGGGAGGGGGGGLPSVSDILSKFPDPGDLPVMFQGLGKYVLGKATGYVKDKIGNLFTGQAQPGTMGLGGPIAQGLVPQVVAAVQWARGHGWGGQVTSGFRSRAEQARLYARYLAGGPLAARPGTSSHEKGQAVDVTDYGAFGAAMASAPKASKLYNRLGAADPVHYSVSGFKHGGITGSEGLAYLHANEAVIPLAKGGKISGKPGPYAGLTVSIGAGKYVTIQEYQNMLNRGFDPSDTSRRLGPVTAMPPPEQRATEENTAAQDEANRLQEEANRIAEEAIAQQKRHDDLVAQQVANQLKLIALTNQGPAILASVVAAVSGNIGGKVGLGFQSPSYSGGMAAYK